MQSLEPLEHQFAVFERGDSALIVGAFDQRADTSWRGQPVTVGFFASPDERAVAAVSSHGFQTARGVLTLLVEARPTLVSLEVVSFQMSRAARVRYGLPIRKHSASEPGISNLLILSPRDTAPQSIWETLASVRGSLRVRAGERVGVYWELYGHRGHSEAMRFSLEIRKLGEGEVGALEEVDPRDQAPLDLYWEEVAPAAEIWPRYLDVNVPTDLVPGLHVLQLLASGVDGNQLRAARPLYIE